MTLLATTSLVSGTEVFRAKPGFDTAFEKLGGTVTTIARGAGNKFYVGGAFSSVAGSASPTLARFNGDGSPDAGFRTLPIHGGRIRAIAEQSNGKVVVGGEFTHIGGTERKYLLRLNTDGSFDETFAASQNVDDLVTCIRVRSDDRLLIGGLFDAFGSTATPGLVQLQADGIRDTSFTPAITTSSSVAAIVPLSDGRILVAGSALFIQDIGYHRVLRLHPNGTRDNSFQEPNDYPFTQAQISLISVLGDGRILLGGSFPTSLSFLPVIRLAADGARDDSFSTAASNFREPLVIEEEPDGKLFAMGVFYQPGGSSTGNFGRLNADGSRDTSFPAVPHNPVLPTAGARLSNGRILIGAGGYFNTFEPGGTPVRGFGSVVRTPGSIERFVRASDGSWFVFGDFAQVNGASHATVAHVHRDGTVDSTFAPALPANATIRAMLPDDAGGVIIGGAFIVNQNGLILRNVARLQADGSFDPAWAAGQGFNASVEWLYRRINGGIIAGGYFSQFVLDPSTFVSRDTIAGLTSGGALDTSFEPWTGFPGRVLGVAEQSDGKVVVAASNFDFSYASQGTIKRLSSTGAIDPTFAANTNFDGGELTRLLIQADNKILVGGSFSSVGSLPRYGLARLNHDGVLDLTFEPATFSNTSARAIDLAADGSIWAAGTIKLGGPEVETLVHLESNGSLRAVGRVNGDVQANPPSTLEIVGADNLLVGGTGGAIGSPRRPFVLVEPAPAPVITGQPASVVANAGANVSFTVMVTGPNLSYQWFKNGKAILGATQPTLALTGVTWIDAGSYFVRISNPYDTITSGTVTLAGQNPAPTIMQQPGVVWAIDGQRAELTVAATGVGPLAYQWRRYGTLIPGAHAPSLVLPSATYADEGFYDVVVSDGLNATASAFARVGVNPNVSWNTFRARANFGPRFHATGGAFNTLLGAPDGKFYAAGNFTGINLTTASRVVRLNANGSPDSSFQSAVIHDGEVLALALQPDGKLLVSGTFATVAGATRPNLIRLHADGSLDSSFSTGTSFRPAFFAYGPATVNALTVQADGRILVGGSFETYRGVKTPNLARLLPDGGIDPSFAPASDLSGTVETLIVQSDNRILVGIASSSAPPDSRRWVVRLHDNGARDDTFDANASLNSAPDGLTLLPDGRMLVGGVDYTTTYGITQKRGVTRLFGNGTVDPTFVSTADERSDVFAISVEPDGRLLVSGWLTYPGVSGTVLLARLTADGALQNILQRDTSGGAINVRQFTDLHRNPDGSFFAIAAYLPGAPRPPILQLWRFAVDGARDLAFTGEPRTEATIHAIATRAGGGWAIGGDFAVVDNQSMGGVALLNPDGTLDSAFSPTTGFDGAVHGLAVDGAGRIVAGGTFSTFDDLDALGIARVLPDGSLDPNFDAGGGPTGGGGENGVYAVALTPDNRIVAGGKFYWMDGVQRAGLAMLRSDGWVDSSFVPGNGATDRVNAVTVQHDGSILVGRGNLARLSITGVVDGALTGSSLPSAVFGVTLLPGGHALACGYQKVWRILTAGGFDPTFHQFTSGELRSQPSRVLIPFADGRAFVCGTLDAGSSALLESVRADGTVATRPAVAGILTTKAGPEVHTAVHAIGGAVLLGGRFLELAGATRGGLVLLEPTLPPIGTTADVSQPLAAASPLSFNLGTPASNDGATSYQWQFRFAGGNFVDIPGASEPFFGIASLQRFHSGSYRLVASVLGKSVASDPMTVTVAAPAPNNARLLNLSTRAQALTGDGVLIPGFVVAGTGSKRLLIRAVGPTLGKAPFDIGGVLPDPRLRLLRRNPTTQVFDEIAANDNWGTNVNAAAITQTSAALFAFGLKDDREAALLMDIEPGEYTVIAGGVNNYSTGLAIVELYDADSGAPGSRLINISNRGFCGVGDQVMIPGFVVSHEGPKTVLVRVVGPTLGGFNVPGTMTDPKLTLYSGQAPILANDNWGDNPDAAYTAQIATQVSAFPLTAGSTDAAFVVTLQPGSYTVVGSSAVAGGTGVVLVEVYVVP